MSKQHESNRRRTYGRRQHEINERPDRTSGYTAEGSKAELPWPQDRWTASLVRPLDADWPNSGSAR